MLFVVWHMANSGVGVSYELLRLSPARCMRLNDREALRLALRQVGTQEKVGLHMGTRPFVAYVTGCRLDLVATAVVAAARVALLRAIAVGAIDGLIATGRERHLGVLPALGAYRRVHLAFATAVATAAATTTVAAATVTSGLASGAAVGAATRGAEALGLVEFLFTFGERELLCAVDAGEVLI